MTLHEQFAEDLAVYAIGALEGQERSELELHLRDCSDCQAELAQLRGDAALLALSVSGPVPSQQAKQRFLRSISSDLNRKPVRSLRPSLPWWAVSGWAAAAVALAFTLFLWHDHVDQRRRLDALNERSRERDQQLLRANELVSILTDPKAVRVTLVAANTPPQPQGKAIYVRETGGLIFLANSLPQLPSGKAYELWLIPETGNPIPAGVFKPDTHGGATVVRPPLPRGVRAAAFAVTVEPESGSSAPTSTPILIGKSA
jgi:anti-sigma-K factor RskA